MAVRTKAEFEALYGSSGTIFADNTTGDISAEDQRDFGQDIADSFNIGEGIQSATAAGTDTYTATISGVSAYTSGDTFSIKFTNANTGAATININSLGAKSLVKLVSTALAASDISAGQSFIIRYDGTNFQLLGAGQTSSNVNDTAFATSWDGVTTDAPSKNAVYDALGGLQITTFNIGDWDMDTNATVQVSLPGSLTANDIRAIDIFIRNDADTAYYKLDKYDTVAAGSASGWVEETASQVKLRRRTGGDFDGANFNATSYNRGYITIWTVV